MKLEELKNKVDNSIPQINDAYQLTIGANSVLDSISVRDTIRSVDGSKFEKLLTIVDDLTDLLITLFDPSVVPEVLNKVKQEINNLY